MASACAPRAASSASSVSVSEPPPRGGDVARETHGRLVELVGVGRRHDDVHAREHGGADERAADVVGIADVGQAHAGEVGPEALAQREQIGQRLARMMVVREAVDHGHARELRQLVDVGLRERADHDRVEIAREHHRGVAHGLAAAELELALRHVERVAAELVHADLERHARARRGLVEDHAERSAGAQLVRRARLLRGLQGDAEGQQPVELGRREIPRAQDNRSLPGTGRLGQRCCMIIHKNARVYEGG